MKKIHTDLILSTILCIVLGILLILNPIETADLFCRVIAIIMLAVGIIIVLGFILHFISGVLSSVFGLFLAVFGIWMLVKPEIFMKLIPVIIGIVLLYHGIEDLRMSLEIKKTGSSFWGKGLIMAVINLILGVVCIMNAFGVIKLAAMILGIALLFNGVTNAFLLFKTAKAVKEVKKNTEPIDVEYTEKE